MEEACESIRAKKYSNYGQNKQHFQYIGPPETPHSDDNTNTTQNLHQPIQPTLIRSHLSPVCRFSHANVFAFIFSINSAIFLCEYKI